MRRALFSLLVLVGSLAACAAARADTIKVLPLSQQYGPQRAAISARISVRHDEPGRSGRAGDTHPSLREDSSAWETSHSGGVLAPRYPALPRTSPLLRDATPLGPGSFWYADGAGHVCEYLPDSVLPCFQLVEGRTGAPALDPQAIAAAVAYRLPLSPGELHASPAAQGLTGAESWFWLEPAPGPRTLSITLAAETVTVTAEPSVEWRFGDGSHREGSAGRPYQAGPPPPDAIVHAYETRCLPGDRGRNPYVLASCAAEGYWVRADVSWRISFRAVGPIDAGGALPTRTTETAGAYPVSEARAFLVAGVAP